jgi:hypothetical protein
VPLFKWLLLLLNASVLMVIRLGDPFTEAFFVCGDFFFPVSPKHLPHWLCYKKGDSYSE